MYYSPVHWYDNKQGIQGIPFTFLKPDALKTIFFSNKNEQ